MIKSNFVFANSLSDNINFINRSISPMSEAAEITKYKYRLNNAKLQKRLWSVTYGRWIDDNWSDC